MMHVLFIPLQFLDTYEPMTSIFHEDQAIAVSKAENIKVGVIAVNPISVKYIVNKKKIDFSTKHFTFNKINVIRSQLPSIPKLKKINNWIRLQKAKQLFKKYIKTYGLPQIIHVQQFWAGSIALWIKNKYHIPYIVTEHSSALCRNMLSNFEKKLALQVYSNSNYNIAVSKSFAEKLAAFSNTHFHYIPNVVDTDFFELKQDKNSNEYIFINVAHFDKNKNQELLIKSFAEAFGGNKKYKLHLVGYGSEETLLKELVVSLGINMQTVFYGRKTRHEIKQLLMNADCFVLSSRFETFGVVLIEAMSCGLPVISTRCGGPESIITNDELGVLCEQNQVSLSEAMKKITTKEFDKNYIRNYALNNFSAKTFSEKIINIYNKIL